MSENNVENLEQVETPITEQDIKETIESLVNYLPKLYDGMRWIGEKFREGRHQQVRKQLFDAVEGLNWSIDVISILFPDKINFVVVNEALRNLIEGIENQDVSNVADVIEYEILDIISTWQQELSIY